MKDLREDFPGLHICSVSDPTDYEIEVAGAVWVFDFSPMFGPIALTKRGREKAPTHAFLRAVSLWRLQGSRLEGMRAIWHEPKKEILEHMGGRHYRVVQHGEPGHDW